jgi:hypothetical protein
MFTPSSFTRSLDLTVFQRVSKVAKMTLRPDPVPGSSSSGKRKRSTTDEQKKAMIREARRLDKLRRNMKNANRREPWFVYIGNVSYFAI